MPHDSSPFGAISARCGSIPCDTWMMRSAVARILFSQSHDHSGPLHLSFKLSSLTTTPICKSLDATGTRVRLSKNAGHASESILLTFAGDVLHSRALHPLRFHRLPLARRGNLSHELGWAGNVSYPPAFSAKSSRVACASALMAMK